MDGNAVMKEEMEWRKREDSLEVMKTIAESGKEAQTAREDRGGYLFLRGGHPSFLNKSRMEPVCQT